jgi:hypothetical protein
LYKNNKIFYKVGDVSRLLLPHFDSIFFNQLFKVIEHSAYRNPFQ